MTAVEFWARPDVWPRDPLGYIFLARAIEEIGRAMFGEDWTGKEVTTDFVRSLPDYFKASIFDASYARDILMKLPEYATQFPPLPEWGDPPSYFTFKEWLAAQAAVRRQQEEQAPTFKRLSAVKLEIVARCESGELISAIRPVVGGAMRIAARVWWNTERWHSRFTMCQLNPDDPFGGGFAGDNFYWIFLTRESLDAYLQKKAAGARPRATARAETAAISELAAMLQGNENMRREEAAKHCVAKFGVTGRGFQQRIWPQAREKAGLPPMAPRGRKSKQL
jgi:hypothetical protein